MIEVDKRKGRAASKSEMISYQEKKALSLGAKLLRFL
jgi:hypothetical protein